MKEPRHQLRKQLEVKYQGLVVHYLGGMKEEEGMKDDCEMLIRQTQEAVLQDKRRDSMWLKGS